MAHDKPVLFERRCTGCNALLFKAVIEVGYIEQKCKCGVMNTIKAERKSAMEVIGMKLPNVGVVISCRNHS